MGTPVHPISLIIFARDDAALSDAMFASGWSASRLPTPGLVFDALFAAIEGSEDPTVETVSHFWRGQPNDFAFVQRAPGAKPSLADPKVRFWRSEYVTGDGLRAFFGTVGVDEASDTEFSQVAISNLAVRDALVRDLVAQRATQSPAIDLPRQVGAGQTAQQVQSLVLKLP
jgi:hypothetical protein